MEKHWIQKKINYQAQNITLFTGDDRYINQNCSQLFTGFLILNDIYQTQYLDNQLLFLAVSLVKIFKFKQNTLSNQINIISFLTGVTVNPSATGVPGKTGLTGYTEKYP